MYDTKCDNQSFLFDIRCTLKHIRLLPLLILLSCSEKPSQAQIGWQSAFPNLPIGRSSFVSLKVFDILGNEITTLVERFLDAGKYSREFDGTGLASGVYYYRMRADGFLDTRSMIMVK